MRTVLTTVRQVRELPAAQARLGIQVRIDGILTYFDRVSNYCFVQDSTGGIRVAWAPGQTLPQAGSRIEVRGLAASGGADPALVDAHVAILGPDVLPKSISLSGRRLRDPQYQYRTVAVTGVVRSVGSERAGLVTLMIRTAGTNVRIEVPASLVVINDDWVDATVRASGVLAGAVNDIGNSTDPVLWVPNPGALQVVSPAKPPDALPPTKTAALLAVPPDHLPAHRVRVRGVPYVPGKGGLAVMDDTGQIAVRMAPGMAKPGARELDVAGFLARENGSLILERAVPTGGTGEGNWERAPEAGSVLTTAWAVHHLSPSAAQLAYRVHLRAEVTFFDPVNYLLFVEDRTDGIFVVWRDKPKVSLRAGDLVDVTGVSSSDFAPDVDRARIRVIGHHGLPKPGRGTFQSAILGHEDCHWIELQGIVERVAPGQGDTLLTVVWGRDHFKAHVLASQESLAPLVDAEVRMHGVCGALFNGKRQLLGIQLFVPAKSCIRVLRAPGRDPFSMPPTLISDLLQFSETRDMGHRVRLRGTVTYGDRAGSTWVRDSTGGLMIQDLDTEGLTAGDQVDVVGFPAIVGFGPVLRGSQIRKLRSGAPPAPVPITAVQAMKGDFNGQLVEIEGKLLDRLQQPPEQVLAIESGDTIFDANLPSGGGALSLEPGMLLRLTGICSVEVEQDRDLILPRTFRLLLRSPADVAVLSRPAWLTANRVAPMLAGAMLLIAAALAWAGLLRKRVRSQTQVLRAQTMQLQVAHQRTRDALHKAREAEALDLDSKRILELIARDEPVDLIIDHIAEAVAVHAEGAVCVILLPSKEGLRVCAVPALPAGWLEAFECLDLRSITFNAEFRDCREFSDHPRWKDLSSSQSGARFRSFRAAPIVVDSATAGVVATLFRNEKPPAEMQCDLALWCNIAALALERRRLHDQLSYRAHHDELTGLPNRSVVYERLEREIAIASHGGGLLGVLYLDLDGFKEINDTYGHGAGDIVLQEAALRMTQCVRRGDTVGRIGGDEFVILLPRLTRREDAEQISAKIAQVLREPIHFEQRRLSVSASVGIGIWPLDGDQPDPLLKFADSKMYGQKKRRWYETTAAPVQTEEAAEALTGLAPRRPAG